MKIRIKGNSIRYRLTKSEVTAFCDLGYFKETTQFGEANFTYELRLEDGKELMWANFKNNTITLYLNREKGRHWAVSDLVGFQHTLHLGNGELALLLEKDFVCMDETVEDQSDNYPNPRA